MKAATVNKLIKLGTKSYTKNVYVGSTVNSKDSGSAIV